LKDVTGVWMMAGAPPVLCPRSFSLKHLFQFAMPAKSTPPLKHGDLADTA